MRSILRVVGSVLVLGLLAMALWAMPVGAAPFAYVAHECSGSVSVIATATNTVVATIPVPNSGPFGVAITPDGAFAYVTGVGSSVSVIATATNTVVATIPVGLTSGDFGLAITPDGASVYVANDLSTPESGTGSVSVIATATNTVVATIPVGLFPVGVAITPDGASAYVANNGARSVSVIATATNTVVTTVAVVDCPDGVAITPSPVTPFAAFTATVEIELGPRRDDAFTVQARFTLGAGSNGIDPLTENVMLELRGGTGSFTTTIPVGSFTKDEKGRFEFEGTINGVDLQAQITPLGGKQFACKVEGEHADLTGIANPVTVTLTIGNDRGSTTVRAEFNHHEGNHGDGEDRSH